MVSHPIVQLEDSISETDLGLIVPMRSMSTVSGVRTRSGEMSSDTASAGMAATATRRTSDLLRLHAVTGNLSNVFFISIATMQSPKENSMIA